MTIEEVQNLVIDAATACGLDPVIAFYQIQRESGFRERAVGSSGERGIAQFMEGTWARFGEGSFENAFDPVKAIAAYCRYMIFLLGLFNDYEKALQGYNGGEGNVQRGTVPSRAQAYAREILSQARVGDIGTIVVTGGQAGQQSDWLKWGLIGLIGLAVYMAISD